MKTISTGRLKTNELFGRTMNSMLENHNLGALKMILAM